MPSLWTDEDHGTHPWIAASPHGAVTPPAPAPAAHDDRPAATGGWARPALLAAAAGAAAAIAGALIELLR